MLTTQVVRSCEAVGPALGSVHSMHGNKLCAKDEERINEGGHKQRERD